MFTNKGGLHSGMLVLHEGMLAPDKGVLLSNADNHVGRHRRMLVPDNKVLISYKEASSQHT